MHIVIITASAKALFGLRKELVESWIKAGHSVTAIGEIDEASFAPRCQESGFSYKQVLMERNGLNPVKDFKTLRELTALLRNLHPDRVFCTFAKAVAYGAWAAKKAGIAETYCLISGLGSGFRGRGLKTGIIRIIMSVLYRNAFACCKKVVFQNRDDLDVLVKLGLLNKNKAEIVNGSGVDLNRFESCELPNNNTFLFVGRLLKEKGIREYIGAAAKIKQTYPNARFLVVGDIDTNPSSLSRAEVEKYQSSGLIEFYGFQSDVRPFMRQCEVFVLPSYHEGTPRCVLEAMSMGRPIITTDAPGCRETVIQDLNGYLIPVGNANELSDKMEAFILDHRLSARMGHASRNIAEEKYDVNKVVAEYRRIMSLG